VKQVFTAQHSAEAHLVRTLLEAAGIEADVQGEWLLGNRLEPSSFLPTVWVLDDGEAERAQTIVRQYERREPPTGSTGPQWSCPKCGELIEHQFTACWQCGAEQRSA
jgi:hypothetical protein